MADLLTTLESFNRKERFFLVAQALNGRMDKPAFTPNADFLQELCDKVDAPAPEKGERVFVAMDYHLNWVHASLVRTHPEQYPYGVGPFPNTEGIVGGSQQDIDLLVAFPEGVRYHLILIEAKAYGSWDKDQLQLKAPKLEKIFGDDGKKYGEVTPHFLLVSPNQPTSSQLGNAPWPQWTLKGRETPLHMKLSLPPKGSGLNVGRSNAAGNSARDGGHFRIWSF